VNSGTLNSDQPKETEVPFEFGKNWSSFLSVLNRERIEAAENSLRQLLELDDSRSRRFLDAGCGSGLFSLAAYRLDAEVTSFDVDRASTECVRELKRRYAAETTRWKIFDGSLLDERFLQGLGTFDVVYCWGVAHHTGNMWGSIENLIPLVSDGSLFVLAIYNDQLYVSKVWRGVKKYYQRLPGAFRPLLVFGVWLTSCRRHSAISNALNARRSSR
jgi:2-polyprenyl-6-hydroxyphenyl methylase/3-demethylubiquinone-9 3-methyltransferase